MRRLIILSCLLVVCVASPALARSRTYFGFQIGVSNAPPPPVFVYHEEPHVVFVPQSRVYVVEDPDADDYDVFRYGPYWYTLEDGYWYRARDYDGPYRVVDVRYVPRPIFAVPEKHWKHYRVRRDERDDRYYYVAKEKHKESKRKHGRHHDDD